MWIGCSVAFYHFKGLSARWVISSNLSYGLVRQGPSHPELGWPSFKKWRGIQVPHKCLWVPHELPHELLTSCLTSRAEFGARVPPALLRVLPTTHECLMSPSRVAWVPHEPFTSSASAPECFRVPHEFRAVRQFGANFKHVWNLPEFTIMLGKTRRVAPEFLMIYTSYSRVSRVTHELREFRTRGQHEPCLTRPLPIPSTTFRDKPVNTTFSLKIYSELPKRSSHRQCILYIKS